MKKISALLGVSLLAAAILGGCSGEPVAPGHGVDYRVEGVLVKFLSNGAARIDLTLTKDSVAYKKAVITLGTTVLDTNSYGYSKTFSSGTIVTGQNYNLNIHDSTSLNVNLIITLPGALTVDITNLAASRIYSGLSVTVGWTPSANADAYILATVPPYGAITDSGYTTWVYGDTTGTIPPNPFRYNDFAVSGTHSVYAVAFTGAPTKTIGFSFLIPALDGPDDNVSKKILFGRLAGMVVSAPDSVVVP